MFPPKGMTRVVHGKRYSVDTAELLAGNDWWDGHNHERNGTNTFLYRTKRGAFFFVELTQWQGQHDAIVPCTEAEAVDFFDGVGEEGQRVGWGVAFPSVTIEEA